MPTVPAALIFTEEDLRDEILDYVAAHGCAKAVDLVAQLSTLWYTRNKSAAKDSPVVQVLDDMVDKRKLVEVTYVSPNMNYREKSLYFLGETKITVVTP